VNGTFRLYTEGDGGVFEITPSQGINQVSFLVRVKNPTRLDYERLKGINTRWSDKISYNYNFHSITTSNLIIIILLVSVINFTLVAEEVGKEKKKSKVGMTVFLRDGKKRKTGRSYLAE